MPKARVLFTLVVLVFTQFAWATQGRLDFPFVPDQEQTTGDLCSPQDPDFQRYRYEEHIPYCERNVDSSLKQDIYRTYGISRGCQKEYTIDHFIPLSLGGTNHRENLWPEAKAIKRLRYNLENTLYLKLEHGQITQKEAIRIIVEAKLNPPVSETDSFSFCR